MAVEVSGLPDNTEEVILEVRGGALVSAYSSSKKVSLLLVDWDDIEEQGLSAVEQFPIDDISLLPVSTKNAVASFVAKSVD